MATEAPIKKNTKTKTKPIVPKEDTAKKPRTLIPKGWPRDVLGATDTGFVNQSRLCYRNVIFQMLMHAPVFLNWVNWYKKHHAGKDDCEGGQNRGPCKICLFHDISTPYWEGGESEEILGSCDEALDILSAQVWSAWGRQGKEGDIEEDSPEYFEHLYHQLLQDVKPMFKQDLRDIFEIGITETKTCDGPCAAELQQEVRQTFLTLGLPEEVSSIEDAIADFCAPDSTRGQCGTCKKPRYYQQAISQLPEMLLVQLNRLDGEGKTSSREISLKNLVIDKKVMHSSADVEYELTSVVIYVRSDPSDTMGHYNIAAKGQVGSWAYLDDDNEITKDKEKQFQAKKDNRQNCYVFAYRRLPISETLKAQKPAKKTPARPLPGNQPVDEPVEPANTVNFNSAEFKGLIASILDQYRAQDKKDWEDRRKERREKRRERRNGWHGRMKEMRSKRGNLQKIHLQMKTQINEEKRIRGRQVGIRQAKMKHNKKRTWWIGKVHEVYFV